MMTYHIACRVGPADSFTPSPANDDAVYPISFAVPGGVGAVRSNIPDLLRARGLRLPPAATDLLHLAAAAYAADVGILRARAYDGWTRDLAIHLPVHDPDRWAAALPILSEMLGFLSGDHWTVHCRPFASPIAQEETAQLGLLDTDPTAVSLFSGGLDSFAGTIERLEGGASLVLVGHHGMGATNGAQERAHAAITAAYPERTILLPFFVQPPSPLEGARKKEITTRSRSILFLALGTAVSAAIRHRLPLLVPENGLISINAPLTDSRTGSSSTRTTHPHFVGLYRQFLGLIGLDIPVQLPYRFQTKGEMLRCVLDAPAFQAGFRDTVSCSHPEVGRYRGATPGQHCGYCVPCIIRRSALHAVGLDEPSAYLDDVRTRPPAIGSKTSQDLRAFEIAVARFAAGNRRQHLCAVLDSGPIPPAEIADFVAVYERGMVEVQQFLIAPAPAITV